MANNITRRGVLGALGAAALAGIAFPFKPKPQDIVIATEMPPVPATTPVQASRSTPVFTIGEMLYDKHGNELAIITNMRIKREAIEVEAASHFRQFVPGLVIGRIEAELIQFPFRHDQRQHVEVASRVLMV